MNAATKDAEAIFFAALDQSNPQERVTFIEAACSGDVSLLARVRQLLLAHDQLHGPLDQPPPGVSVSQNLPIAEQPGTIIGPYKLLEQIGEGGFGVVFMAEQLEPIHRKVALKVIKPGMDTKEVIARFEAERQALAIMDHPNIAKVLDAGQTAGGRPYFVMDLVKGLAITDYCDQARLTARERLLLFVDVCQAVQHAHQKSIIHRDIKPSNVLVTMNDGSPLVKVIDFGIAKALSERLTEKTLFTGFAKMLGSPLYMSPEQAAFSNNDVDTRTDIYSLGVLLYELLTGTTPFDKERLNRADYDEMRRIIREEDPPKPSTRISTLGQAATTISTQRRSDPKRLQHFVRGELDWIVMKALEKDRNRRYETANALSQDIIRYLSDEPVSACPPSTWYRFRKFARRNTGAVLAATVIVLLLCAGIAGTSWGLVRAEQARQAEADQRGLAEAALVSERAAKEAEAEQRGHTEIALKKAVREAATAAAINDFLNKDLLLLASTMGQANSGVSPDANLKLRTVLQRAATRIDGKFPHQPEVEMKLRYTIGYAFTSVGDYAAL